MGMRKAPCIKIKRAVTARMYKKRPHPKRRGLAKRCISYECDEYCLIHIRACIVFSPAFLLPAVNLPYIGTTDLLYTHGPAGITPNRLIFAPLVLYAPTCLIYAHVF